MPASIAPQIASQPLNSLRQAPAIPLARVARIAATGVVSLVLLGGGVWFATKGSTTSGAPAQENYLTPPGTPIQKSHLEGIAGAKQVMSEVKGINEFDISARQLAALEILRNVVEELSEGRVFLQKLTPEESEQLKEYRDARDNFWFKGNDAASCMSQINQTNLRAELLVHDEKELPSNLECQHLYARLRSHYGFNGTFINEIHTRYLSKEVLERYSKLKPMPRQAVSKPVPGPSDQAKPLPGSDHASSSGGFFGGLNNLFSSNVEGTYKYVEGNEEIILVLKPKGKISIRVGYLDAEADYKVEGTKITVTDPKKKKGHQVVNFWRVQDDGSIRSIDGVQFSKQSK